MLDWRKRVEILRAENALRDGRLDEAYAIASDRDLRGWRGCQVVLEKLVDPLLDRAAIHLAEGRLQDALADVERAASAGGNRPRVAELRAKVCAALEERRRGKAIERDLVQSVRRRLDEGSVQEGRALLEGIAAEDPEAARLAREARHREEKARDACARAELLLGKGALLEAAGALLDAQGACARHEGLPPLLLQLKDAGLSAVEKALNEGSLAAAAELLDGVVGACGESLEARRLVEALEICREASRALERRSYADARAQAARIARLLPGAAWVAQCEESLLKVCEGLQDLRACPISGLRAAGGAGEARREPAPAPGIGETVCEPALGPASGTAAPAMREKGLNGMSPFILWVDGVGSYLVLRSDRLTIGRLGSSARPDLALAADIQGIHAEVLRADDDYFIVSRGAVQVNGKAVERRLLANGDRISLSPRCEILFRIPTPLSTSAVLALPGRQRIAGDVREAILMDRHILIGRDEGCHVRAAGGPPRMLLSTDGKNLTLRAEDGIMVDGKPRGKEAPVEPGSQIKVGEVTFTVTPLEGERY